MFGNSKVRTGNRMADDKKPGYWKGVQERWQINQKLIRAKKPEYYARDDALHRHFLRAFVPLFIILLIPCGLLEFLISNQAANYLAVPGW